MKQHQIGLLFTRRLRCAVHRFSVPLSLCALFLAAAALGAPEPAHQPDELAAGVSRLGQLIGVGAVSALSAFFTALFANRNHAQAAEDVKEVKRRLGPEKEAHTTVLGALEDLRAEVMRLREELVRTADQFALRAQRVESRHDELTERQARGEKVVSDGLVDLEDLKGRHDRLAEESRGRMSKVERAIAYMRGQSQVPGRSLGMEDTGS